METLLQIKKVCGVNRGIALIVGSERDVLRR